MSTSQPPASHIWIGQLRVANHPMIGGYVLHQDSLMKISNVNAYSWVSFQDYCALIEYSCQIFDYCAFKSLIPGSADWPWNSAGFSWKRTGRKVTPPGRHRPLRRTPGLPWRVAVAWKMPWNGRQKPWRSAAVKESNSSGRHFWKNIVCIYYVL